MRKEKFYYKTPEEVYEFQKRINPEAFEAAADYLDYLFNTPDKRDENKQEIKGFEEKDCFVDIAWKRFHKTFTKNLWKMLDNSL